jgi:hypothetical protein
VRSSSELIERKKLDQKVNFKYHLRSYLHLECDMKKAFFLLACILAVSTAHAKVKVFNDVPQTVSWSELSVEKLQEFIYSKNSSFAVEVKEGTIIPLQFLTKTRIFSAIIDPNLVIRAEKPCYFRVADKKCYISEDLTHWEKAEKFLSGKSTLQLTSSPNKPGLTLETSIVPYQDEEEE